MCRQAVIIKCFTNFVYFFVLFKKHIDIKGFYLEWHSRGQRFDPAYLHQRKRQRAERLPVFFFCKKVLRGSESLSMLRRFAVRQSRNRHRMRRFAKQTNEAQLRFRFSVKGNVKSENAFFRCSLKSRASCAFSVSEGGKCFFTHLA